MDAQLIVSLKLNTFAADAQADQTRVAAIKKAVDDQIKRFNQPETWLTEVNLDQSQFFSCLVAINAVQSPDVDDLDAKVQALIKLLSDDKAASASAGSTATAAAGTAVPNRNQEALEALQNIRRKIMGRARFFMGQGIDLATDTTFQTLRARQKPLRENYTRQLRDETVLANEVDVVLLNGFAGAIQAATTLPPFFQHYGELSDFIEARCPLPPPSA